MASARIAGSALPYLPGSQIPIQIDGLDAPYSLEVIGPGAVLHGTLSVPDSPDAADDTVVASGHHALAVHRFRFASPPHVARAFIAVAAYDSGIVVHDADAPFAARSVLGIGGAPSDVAIDGDGRIAAGNTAGDTLFMATMDPWRVRAIAGVALSDELAFDPATHALFATDRDISGSGALTRVLPDGTVSRRILGVTSEGVAVDSRRRRVYVANANDGTVSIVDSTTMTELRRFHAIDRAFSLALSPDGSRLFAVSNQSVSSPFAAAGRVIAIDVAAPIPRVVARSAPLAFPLGVVAGSGGKRIFVTDERDDDVYVLDSRTLQPLRRPIATCRTPWKPAVDAFDHRLYVPCAQADRIDVIDTRTLQRVPGAPFATGGYPLSVAVWHSWNRVTR